MQAPTCCCCSSRRWTCRCRCACTCCCKPPSCWCSCHSACTRTAAARWGPAALVAHLAPHLTLQPALELLEPACSSAHKRAAGMALCCAPCFGSQPVLCRQWPQPLTRPRRLRMQLLTSPQAVAAVASAHHTMASLVFSVVPLAVSTVPEGGHQPAAMPGTAAWVACHRQLASAGFHAPTHSTLPSHPVGPPLPCLQTPTASGLLRCCLCGWWPAGCCPRWC